MIVIRKSQNAKSLRETIYEQIRDDITFGKLYPGQRLTEATLANALKASRSPVREALRQLESEGLITFERNKGIAVSKLSLKEVDEIFDIRMVLEGYAALLTAEQSITKDDLRYLKQLNKSLQQAAQKNDVYSWLELNASFHKFFQARSGNHNLEQLISMLERRVYRYKYMSVSFPHQFSYYLEQHEKIINACEQSKPALVMERMKEHLVYVKGVIVNYLKKFPYV
ncbi:MAG: HTH-type transcriptional regulator McbR [Syntrophaceae bacterium PtaU1.Bin231]|nr:MAG: HTH-type transcriptional regulator McbR [Syntrophaceae bacterium PtaU1.Bin231]